jgi:glutamate synthase (NADPH/NADH) large chain
MSGGIAYVYDPDGEFEAKCNLAMVSLESVLAGDVQAATVDTSVWHSILRGGEGETDEAILRSLIERHFKHTGSTRARNILDDWARSRAKFIKVFPNEYKRALAEMAAAKQAPVSAKAA